MENAWFYVENDSRIGPVERGELERLISKGTVTSQTLVWQDGLDGWEEARLHFQTSVGVSASPPFPPRGLIAEKRVSPGRTGSGKSNGVGTNGLYIDAPARGFQEAISICFNKYVTFSGRASRSEYWYFFLFCILIGLATSLIDIAMFGYSNNLSPVNTLATLALFLPSLSVLVRRLHDTDRSGWWVGSFWIGLICFVVMIGMIATSNPYADSAIGGFSAVFVIFVLVYSIIMLVFICKRGNVGSNRFG